MKMHDILIRHRSSNETDCFTTLLLRSEENISAWTWHSFSLSWLHYSFPSIDKFCYQTGVILAYFILLAVIW